MLLFCRNLWMQCCYYTSYNTKSLTDAVQAAQMTWKDAAVCNAHLLLVLDRCSLDIKDTRNGIIIEIWRCKIHDFQHNNQNYPSFGWSSLSGLPFSQPSLSRELHYSVCKRFGFFFSLLFYHLMVRLQCSTPIYKTIFGECWQEWNFMFHVLPFCVVFY